MTDSRISVVIVTYNSRRVILDCLTHLISSSSENLEVIVVDNASDDGTADIIRAAFPRVRLLQGQDNVGFAKGVNAGARIATGSNLVLLNPDAVITEEALRNLVRRLEEYGSPCIIAPLIAQPDGRLRIVSAGRFPTPWRMFTHYSGLSRLLSGKAFEGHYLLPKALSSLESTDWVTGAVLAIKRHDWETLGGLSERWFMYAEDIDLCWRAKGNGMDVLLSSDVVATHLVGGSTSEPRSMNADWVLNLFDFYSTSMNGNGAGRFFWKLVVITGLISRSVAYRALSRRDTAGERERMWLHESKRFSSFAHQLLKSR